MIRNASEMQQRFAIRRYTLVAASVLLGIAFLGQAQVVKADEQSNADVSPAITATVVSKDTKTTTNDTENISYTEGDSTERLGVTPRQDSDRHTVYSENQLPETANQSDSTPSNPSVDTSEQSSNTTVPDEQSGVDIVKDVSDTSLTSAVTPETDDSATLSSNVTTKEPEVSLPDTGNYVFPKTVNVYNEPNTDTAALFTFDKGDQVYYDQVLKENNHEWISYKSSSKERRYVDIADLTPVAVDTMNDAEGVDESILDSSAAQKLPNSGIYRFTKRSGIKNEPKMTSATVYYYNVGEAVKYDKTLVSDNHEWISYISYNGTRRYIAVGDATQSTPVEVKPSDKTQDTPKTDGKNVTTITGGVKVTNVNNVGGTFDVIISNVSDTKGVKEVKVPVWTSKDDQDDIVWYDAAKQADGTYKTTVNIKDHKNEYGEYNIHLYYIENDGKMVGVYATSYQFNQPKTTNNQNVNTLPPSGKYTFKSKKDVRNDAKMSAKVEFSFDKGDEVYYDKVLTADNYEWISYISHNGIRRYIALSKVEDNHQSDDNKKSSDSTTSLPSSGTYTFTSRASIKNEPKMDAKELAYYDKGNSVNYDKTLAADGHEWISYISFSGSRRYIAVSELPSVNTPNNDKGTETSTTAVTGNIAVENADSKAGSFDVVLSNVKDTKGIQEVIVPVWTTANNQDDIVWYRASKQSNGNYKVTVKVKDHKNEYGQYNIHLYYKQTDGQMVGVAATTYQLTQPKSTDSSQELLPASGTYTFKEKTDVRNDAKISARVEFSFNKGDKVNYDRVLTGEGKTWISYLSNSGTRRYIAITATNSSQINSSKDAASSQLPSSGVYTFKSRASIKDEPKVNAKELAYYDKGSSVNYDKTLVSDGYEWISYLSYTGTRRYISVGKANETSSKATSTSSQDTKSIPSSGTYTFDKRVDVRNSADINSPVQFSLDKGYNLNYDKLINENGKRWMSYVSFSGQRRYILLDK